MDIENNKAVEHVYYPHYKRASYANEFAVMQNDYIRVVWFKRLSGWGFAEIYTAEGKLMGVLDYLGELMVRDQEIPMRLEAETYRFEEAQDTFDIVFDVQTMAVQKLLDDTSFAPWIHYPFETPCLTGTVRVSLSRTEPIIKYSMRVTSCQNMYVSYIRGPWLKVGEGSFGTEKTDAILPGVEWVLDKEWSSGNDWFRKPWADKFVPHRNKVSIPCMSVSHDGKTISMAWDNDEWTTRWFNYDKQYPQPVFAVPNFIDRDNNSLIGLMIPCASNEKDENQPYAAPPLEMHLHQQVRMDCEIFISDGNSAEAITEYVKKKGLPKSNGEDDIAFLYSCIAKAAGHYNTNLWHGDKGFGIPQKEQYSHDVPNFIRRYVRENMDSPTAIGLSEKIKICDEIKKSLSVSKEDANKKAADAKEIADKLKEKANKLLAAQQSNGTFCFEPDGRHKSKDDFTVARVFCEPMGINMDTALDMNMMPAAELINLSVKLKAEGDTETSEKCLTAAKRAIAACDDMIRPEGGDYWETPLHAPNLLAAGHAAVTYYKAYKTFGEERYKEKAVYWLRTMLPFTHMWQPENKPMLYNTKPCFCSSDWYFANWVRDHVQWEVLFVFAQSASEGIDWADIDKEIDWHRYQEGVTLAGVRWLADHKRADWMPHNIPTTYEAYQRGDFDGCLPDTHNSVTGNYGGMFMMPTTIADNLYNIIDRLHRRQEQTK